MKTLSNEYRIKNGPFATTQVEDGNNGAFAIPHPRIKNYVFICLASDQLGWEHVSISLKEKQKGMVKRCPTWEEMCFIKDLFWYETECVVQFHPPKSDHVSVHDYCLHLWRYTKEEFPRPSSLMVG